MRKRRTAKTTIGYIIVFILALALSVAAVQVLPIPGEFKKMVFFLLIPAISMVGVFILSIPKKKKR